MATKSIGIGLAGLSVGQGWAQSAHLPALRSLSSYHLAGVANSNLASSKASAELYAVPHAFADVASMAADPSVDLVAVAVKVPHHLELVQPALRAGKMVFCEWPLGNGLAEAQELADAARAAGVRTLIGLESWSSPTVRYVRDLVQDGFVGKVLSTTLVGSGGNWGPVVNARNAYTADDKNGATLLSIPFGHTIDALCHCLGEFTELSATTARRISTFRVSENDQELPFNTDDQLAISGILTSGTLVAAHYRGGQSRATNLRWEINGTDGDLEITGESGHLELTTLVLRGARGDERQLADLAVPDRYRTVDKALQGVALNVAEAYNQFALGDQAVFPVPDFDHAVHRHRFLDAVSEAARSGTRIVVL